MLRRFALFLRLFVEGRRPGLRPGRRLTFFVSPKKVSKERRPDVHALLRRVRCAAQLGRGLAKLAALKQTRALIRPSLRCSPCPTGGGDREPTAAAAQRRHVVSIGGRGGGAARGRTSALPNTSSIDSTAPLDAQKPTTSARCSQARPHPIPLAPWGRAEQRSARGIRPRVCLSAASLAGTPLARAAQGTTKWP